MRFIVYLDSSVFLYGCSISMDAMCSKNLNLKHLGDFMITLCYQNCCAPNFGIIVMFVINLFSLYI